MRTHTLLIVVIVLLACTAWTPAHAVSDALPAADDRIKIIRYDENDVYTITTKFGYQTNIVFGPNESIETISVGDRSLWQIIPSGNRLFIRPMQQGISTNMTILTNRHSYQFDLKSLAAEDKEDKAIYVAKFLYAGNRPSAPPMMAPPPAPPPPPIAAVPPAPAPIPPEKPATSAVYTNYNYTYSGPDTLAPLQVFDNGTTTYLKYKELPAPKPNIYTVDINGKRTSVVAEEKTNMLAIPLIASRLELEHEGGTIVVYNEMLNAGN